jgi:hypothetical protein
LSRRVVHQLARAPMQAEDLPPGEPADRDRDIVAILETPLSISEPALRPDFCGYPMTIYSRGAWYGGLGENDAQYPLVTRHRPIVVRDQSRVGQDGIYVYWGRRGQPACSASRRGMKQRRRTWRAICVCSCKAAAPFTTANDGSSAQCADRLRRIPCFGASSFRRGNRRELTFCEADDYAFDLDLLTDAAERSTKPRTAPPCARPKAPAARSARPNGWKNMSREVPAITPLPSAPAPPSARPRPRTRPQPG